MDAVEMLIQPLQLAPLHLPHLRCPRCKRDFQEVISSIDIASLKQPRHSRDIKLTCPKCCHEFTVGRYVDAAVEAALDGEIPQWWPGSDL